MQYIHDLVSQNILTLSPFVRDVIIFIFAYFEGLPVITILFPGTMVALMIGSFTHTGEIAPFVAINMIALGSFFGDLTSLYCGPYLLKIKWFKNLVEKDEHQKYWNIFEKNIALIIIFSKLLPMVRSTPSLFAGARNMSKAKYFFYTFIGSYLWAVVGIYGGGLLGKIFGNLALPLIFVAFLILGIVPFVMEKITTKKV